MRNPLAVVPRAAYLEDFVSGEGGSRRYAWVTSPALIKAVLLDERDKFQKLSQIRLLRPLLGKGILTSEGADWRWQRQASSPMFRREDLLGFVPTFVSATGKLLAGWRREAQGVRPIDRDMARVTFDVISATLLPSADQTVGPVVERSVSRFQQAGAWGQLFAFARIPQWVPRPGFIAGRRSVIELRGAVAQMLRERREMEKGGVPPDDLMHRLMRAQDPETGQRMNDEQLIDNLLTFYLAGHETTARALTWTLFLLARFPEWSEKLSNEVKTVTSGAPVEARHIDRLVLVQQVIKESMRLYPPVPLMSRQAVVDTALAGHPIPAGTSVVMPIYVIHRHERRWEQPDEFAPERFAPEAEARMARYQYMPFGAGPRICIGRAFAEIEAAAILATLLQHASFAPVAGHEPAPIARVTLLPGGGMPLQVTLH